MTPKIESILNGCIIFLLYGCNDIYFQVIEHLESG